MTAALTVEQINVPTGDAWRVSTQTAVGVVEALSVAAMLGYRANVLCYVDAGVVKWVVTLTCKGKADLVANNGDWLVHEGTHIAIYRHNEFVAKYTANVPLEWDATVSAEAQSGGRAVLTFPMPLSVNGPFTYTVEQIDVESGSTAEAVLDGGDPVISDDEEVFLTVTGLDRDPVPAPTGLEGVFSDAVGSLDGTYYYVVTAVNDTGETEASDEFSIELTSPATAVDLVWDAVNGATGYRVYRGTTSGGQNTLVAEVEGAALTDTGEGEGGNPPEAGTALAGRDYMFTVTVDTQYAGVAETSPPSNPITAI